MCFWEDGVSGASCLPCEADEDWASRAVIVFWLVEKCLDVLGDGSEISLGAHCCVCVVLLWLNLYPKRYGLIESLVAPVKRKCTDYSLEKCPGKIYIRRKWWQDGPQL